MARRWLDLPRNGTALTMSPIDTSSRTGDAAHNINGAKRSKVSRGGLGDKRRTLAVAASLAIVMLPLAAAIWLVVKADTLHSELQAAKQLIPVLKEHFAKGEREAASRTAAELRSHTSAAREAAGDPLWTLASAIPGLGANFSAVAEVARSADDVATLGVSPLVEVFGSLTWDSILPSGTGNDLEHFQIASPRISSAAHAVRASAERLGGIDTSSLLPQVSEPLTSARDELQTVTGALDAAADASSIVPALLGAEAPRSYLLMIQNNAEARASGGIPGALAVLTVDHGVLSLGSQSTAGAVGVMSPSLPVDPEQRQIYSGRLSKFMQDVNLTPDFPTAAKTAQAMWERKTGQRVTGVVSIDPVALSYLMDGTGPIQVNDGMGALVDGLPAELTGKNVVPTLLSDVYAKIEKPEAQDAYFAGVAKDVFAALASGNGDAKALVSGITRGTAEGRILVWSDEADQQAIIAKYPLSGAVTGPSVRPAQFGVYFNDGTGAKMDYYMKRSVQLVKGCPKDGYQQTTVRVISSNTAPADAATSLPAYVTGAGNFGVPAGSVQTNIVAYGPVQANVETATLEGVKTEFAPYRHSNRPVGVLAVRLAPGESKSVEFTFGKIVQHAEPDIFVTPSAQPVDDVILPTKTESCD